MKIETMLAAENALLMFVPIRIQLMTEKSFAGRKGKRVLFLVNMGKETRLLRIRSLLFYKKADKYGLFCTTAAYSMWNAGDGSKNGVKIHAVKRKEIYVCCVIAMPVEKPMI